MDHGYYVHPLYCFRKDHGGEWGFTCGTGTEDDLPQRMELGLPAMSTTIFQLLQKKDMFPSDSEIPSILMQCSGDGYKALLQILYDHHPAFLEQPATLIAEYPKQLPSQSLLAYHATFVDFLQLRAIIKGHPASLDESDELDLFITRSKYRTYLNRVTLEERQHQSKLHKYTANQIVHTLSSWLRAPHSPMVLERRANLPPSRIPVPPARSRVLVRNDQRNPTRVNTIDATDEVGEHVLAVHSLTVPTDAESRQLHRIYTGAIYQIQASAAAPNTSPCLVCGGNHRFDSCPVLRDTDFLRTHYIRYCQLVQRDARARANASNGSTAVNVLNVDNDDDLSTSEEAPDFQMGGV